MLDESMNDWLRGLLGRHGAVAETVHGVRGDALAINIPPKVQEVTATIVGLAWMDERELAAPELVAIATDAATLP